MRELPFDAVAPEPPRVRVLVAALLQSASRALDALARRLALVEAPAAPAEPQLEFHGDAAAPEGALYVNGQLVGHVLGVNRL
ncbi:MAG: hypothetical protein KIS83_04770 [Rubrivivax sp.]|nr:hypothetical protein [Rubrivivax sp.]MCW5609985.1 hypothetical protein [Rubrivivax sp.]